MKEQAASKPPKSRQEFETEIRQIVESHGNFGNRIPAMASSLSGFLSHAVVSIYLFDGDSNEMTLRATTLRLRKEGGALRFSTEGTISSLAMQERRIVSLLEPERAVEGRRRAEQHVFPLESNGRKLGAVSVVHIGSEGLPRVRLDMARKAIALFARSLGEAKREEAVSQKMARLSAINELGVMLVSSHDLEELVPLASAMATFIMSAEGCVIRLSDEKRENYLVRDCYGFRLREAKEKVSLLDSLVADIVLASGKPVLIRETEDEEEYRSFFPLIRTLVSFPVMSDGIAIGTISVYNKGVGDTLAPPHFTQEDLAGFQHFVKYLEKAISTATMLRRSQELKERDEITGLLDPKSFRARLLAETTAGPPLTTHATGRTFPAMR